ncbi:MAG TPA: hypothetical protein VFG71_09590 [Nitrospiraceae bacterium]|nr:hypothetical protein [Nitrospiraceae bacterium]
MVSALYYPFHLCSEQALRLLLEHFHTLHFRDYMAIQLTPFSGTTAFQDRMGDGYPELVSGGRLIQGHRTSGPLDKELEAAVDRDLADPIWRTLFHRIFTEQRRFQRGLFDSSHGMMIGNTVVPGPAALLCLMDDVRARHPYTVQTVRRLSASQHTVAAGYEFEYGLALIKTAAAGIWTRRLALQHRLAVVTDSPGHQALLRRSCDRDGMNLTDYLLLNGTLQTSPRVGALDEAGGGSEL